MASRLTSLVILALVTLSSFLTGCSTIDRVSSGVIGQICHPLEAATDYRSCVRRYEQYATDNYLGEVVSAERRYIRDLRERNPAAERRLESRLWQIGDKYRVPSYLSEDLARRIINRHNQTPLLYRGPIQVRDVETGRRCVLPPICSEPNIRCSCTN